MVTVSVGSDVLEGADVACARRARRARWSVGLHAAGSPALIAGLPRDSACVAVLPMPVLTWSGPITGLVFGLVAGGGERARRVVGEVVIPAVDERADAFVAGVAGDDGVEIAIVGAMGEKKSRSSAMPPPLSAEFDATVTLSRTSVLASSRPMPPPSPLLESSWAVLPLTVELRSSARPPVVT